MTTTENLTTLPAVRPRHSTFGAKSSLAGWTTMFHKELLEWFRTRRFLITTVVATLIMVVIPIGVWIVEYDGLTAGRATLPADDAASARTDGAGTLLTMSSYLAIVLTAGMLVREREAGTAQWVLTKPVSRVSYGLAKWAANSVGVILALIVVPGAIALGSFAALYHVPGWSWTDQLLAVGLVAVHAVVVVALMLVLGSIFTSIAPVIAVALGVSAGPMILAPLVADSVLRWYPVFRLGDLVTTVAGGQPLDGRDLAPLAAGLIFLVLCLGFAGNRLNQQDLH